MLRSRSPYSVSASERGIGVADMSSTSGASPLAPSALRCSTPKRCCSSIAAKPSLANVVALLHERVRADDEHRLAGRQALRDRLALARREAAGEQNRLDAERREQRAHRPRVLLGEQLGRRHDRRLIAVLDREQRREQRDDRLSAADVALQQAVHAAVAHHVGDDLANGAHLRAGELERQRLAQLRRELALVHEADAGPLVARQLLGALLQAAERRSSSSNASRDRPDERLGERRRAVHHAQRVADARHAGRAQDVGREVLPDERAAARRDACR